MNLNKLIETLSNKYDEIFKDFESYSHDSQSFNIYAGEKLAWRFTADTDFDKPNDKQAFIFLRYQCREFISYYHTCTLIISISTGDLTEENRDAYEYFQQTGIDEIVAKELEMDYYLSDRVSLNTNPVIQAPQKRSAGRKRRESPNLLDTNIQAILFYYLAKEECFSGWGTKLERGNKTAISEIYQSLTNNGATNARRAMENDGLTKEKKKIIVERLKKVINDIENHGDIE